MNKINGKSKLFLLMALLVTASLYACDSYPTAIIDIQGQILGDRTAEIAVHSSLTFKGDRSHDNDENNQYVDYYYWYVWDTRINEPVSPYYTYHGYSSQKMITFDTPGTYKVKLQVRDDEGWRSEEYMNISNTCTITVNDSTISPPIIKNGLPEVQEDGDVIFNGTITYATGQTPNIIVYYHTSDGLMDSGNWPTNSGLVTSINGNGEFSSSEIPGLSPGTLYFFRSYAEYVSDPSTYNDWDETATHGSPNPIQFVTAPEQTHTPIPAIGSTGVPATIFLRWEQGDSTITPTYDVYFGEVETDVTGATHDTTGIFRGNQSERSYVIPETLGNGVPYYWRIDEVVYDEYNNVNRIQKGDTWSFSTRHIYNLNLTIDPLGSGTCIKSPDYAEYYENSYVQVTPIPDLGYEFDHWSGDTESSDPELYVSMDSNKSITAHFTKTAYLLTMEVDSSGEGTTSPSVGTHAVPSDSMVTVHAIPADGYEFDEWTGTGSALDLTGNTNPTVSFTISEDSGLKASYIAVPDTYTVIFSSDESCTITTSGPGRHEFSADVVSTTIEATPDDGVVFVRWEGTAADAARISPLNTAQATLSIAANDTVHAVTQYRLEISASEGGTVTNPGLGIFRKDNTPSDYGEISIEAKADEGYEFKEWSGSAVTTSKIGDKDSIQTTVTMDGDYDVQAIFVKKQHTLTLGEHTNGQFILPDTTVTADYGAVINICALADEGYHFMGWSGAEGNITNPNAEDTTLILRDNYTLDANFEADQYRIDILPSEGGYTNPNNATDISRSYEQSPIDRDITATAYTGYYFDGWAGTAVASDKVADATASGSATTITVDGNYTLRATFEPVEPVIIYVSPHGDDSDGLSWLTAFNHLQDALDCAELYDAVDQIWVAAGTYYPDEDSVDSDNDGDGVEHTNNSRYESFVLVDGVEIYGGFAGGETELEQRDLSANQTILSGDVDHGDTLPDGETIYTLNSYHVVTGVDDAVLDGFTIKDGYVEEASIPGGAGIYCDKTSPIIKNCIITNNFAKAARLGGGVYSGGISSLQLVNCLVAGNFAEAEHCGGVYLAGTGILELVNCTIVDNANDGIHCDGASLLMDNCIVWHNRLDLTYDEREIVLTNATADIQYSNVEAGQAGIIQNNSSLATNLPVDVCPDPQFESWGQWTLERSDGVVLQTNTPLTAKADEIIIYDFHTQFDNMITNKHHDEDNFIADWLCTDAGVYYKKPIPKDEVSERDQSTISGLVNGKWRLWFTTDQDGQKRGPINTNVQVPTRYCIDPVKGVFEFNSDHFFPIDNCDYSAGECFDDWVNDNKQWCSTHLKYHNYFFSLQYHTKMIYVPGQNFEFKASDDLIIAINNRVILHREGHFVDCTSFSTIELNNGNAYVKTTETDCGPLSTTATEIILGLEPYEECEFDLFYLNRSTPVSVLKAQWTPGESELVATFELGDYHLLPDSPCIDAGDNNVIPAGIMTDLDGLSRRIDDPDTEPDTGITDKPIVDMGAYEFQVENTAPVAVDDSFEFVDNNPATADTVTILVADVLANDEDVDQNAFTLHFASASSDADFEWIGNGWNYTPDFTGAGSKTFTYYIYDGIALSNEATVTINIRDIGPLTVNAGKSQTVTLAADGTAEVTLDNAVIAGDGVNNPGATNVDKTWAVSYKPPTGTVTWDDAQILNPTATLTITDPDVFAYMENVQFELQLDGTLGTRSGQNTVIITVLPSSDFQAAPQVDVGTYDWIEWPNGAEQVQLGLDGTVTDDGMPYGVLYYHWTVEEGDSAAVDFDDEFAEDTTVTFKNEGRYKLRLTATDLQKSGSDDTWIFVGDATTTTNTAPTVAIDDNDGTNNGKIEIPLSVDEYPLNISVTDDTLPNPPGKLTYTWSIVPVAGTPVDGMSFGYLEYTEYTGVTPKQQTATFTKSGTYQIRVDVSDSKLSASDTIEVVVNPPDSPDTLQVDAGFDNEIKLPAMAHLVGKATLIDSSGKRTNLDDDHVEVRWSLLGGPARVSFIDNSDQQLYAKAEFTEPGTYTFRLEGKYNEILEHVDEVLIDVKSQQIKFSAGTNHSLFVDGSDNAGAWSCGSYWFGVLGQYLDFEEDTGFMPKKVQIYPDEYCSIPVPVCVWPSWEPIVINPLSDIQQVCATDCVSEALDKAGNVWAWGPSCDHTDFVGVLNLDEDFYDRAHRYWDYWYGNDGYFFYAYPLPVVCGDQPSDSGLLENIVSISEGYIKNHFAVDSQGYVWAYGHNNYYGQLGLGYESSAEWVPKRVRNESNTGFLNNVTKVSSDTDVAIFLERLDCEKSGCEGRVYRSGRLYGAGFSQTNLPLHEEFPDINNDGLHDSTDSDEYGSTYLRDIVDAACGLWNIVAVEAIDPDHNPDLDGNVFTWGTIQSGNMEYYNSDGSRIVTYPILIETPDLNENGLNDDRDSYGSDYLKYIVAVSKGYSTGFSTSYLDAFSMALEKINTNNGLYGYVYMWGDNDYGQLGIGDLGKDNSVLPIRVLAPDLDDDGYSDEIEYGSRYLKDIVAIDAGYGHCFALDNNGVLYAWGNNENGQLGIGSTDQIISLPRKVVFEKTVHNITAGTWYYKIQDAINDEILEPGDHIIVHPCVYYESIDLGDKNIILTSEDPADQDIANKTIIRGGITIDTNTNSNLASIISGFTIKGSVSVNRAGASSNDTITISNNIITDSSGTGVNIVNASAVRILNNQIVKNTTGIALTDSTAIIRNNTIAVNSSQGVNASGTNSIQFLNNIVWDNGSGLNKNTLSSNISSSISDYSFCCVGGNPGTPIAPDTYGNFGDGPQFVQPGYWDAGKWIAGDYHLQTDSPCINAGFMEDDFASTSSFNTTYSAYYQLDDLIIIGNDRTPRTVTDVSGPIQFTPALDSMPDSEIGVIHCDQLEQFEDTTSADGSAGVFVVSDPGQYAIGDIVQIGDSDYQIITYVSPEGEVSVNSTSGYNSGTALKVWKYSDPDGNPRVVNGRVDIGADEFCPWHVDAGQDKTVTVSEQCDTSDASIVYSGSNEPGNNIQLQWSVVDPHNAASVTFGEVGKLITDTLHTSVDFGDVVGDYQLQLTILEDGWPVAWDTVNVDVLYDIGYTGDLDVVLPDPAHIELNIQGTGSPYDIQWKAPITERYGRSVGFSDENSETVDVTLESAGCYPLTVELTDRSTGELVGQQTIVVSGKNPFADVIVESDTDEITLPTDSMSFEGRVEGVLGDYTPEWVVTSSDPDKDAFITDKNSWSTDITFDEPGTYEVSLVVKECESITGLHFPRYTIIGAATKMIEVKRSSVDAGPDQVVEWPQDFACLYGRVDGGDTYLWECDGVTFDDENMLNPTVTFPGTGLYTLTLTAWDEVGALGDDKVNILVVNPDIQVEAGIDKTGKIGDSIELSDDTTIIPDGFTYYWYMLSDEGEMIPLSDPATFADAGTYQVFLTAENGTGFGIDSLVVTVDTWGGISSITSDPTSPVEYKDRESVTFTGSLEGSIYPGQVLPDGVTAQWFIDGDLTDNAWPTTTAPSLALGFHQIRLELLQGETCIDYVTTTVYVSPPSISVDAKVIDPATEDKKDEYVAVYNGVDITLDVKCEQLGAMTGLIYSWSVVEGDSGSVTGLPDPSDQLINKFDVTFTQAGTYTLMFRASDDTSGVTIAKDTVTVVLQSPDGKPIVRAGSNYPIAVENVSFLLDKARIWDVGTSIIPTGIEWLCTSANSADVTWSTDNVTWLDNTTWNSTSSQVQNPYVKFASEGRYDFQLTYTDAEGLSDTDTVSIYVQPNYTVFAGTQQLTYPFMDLKMADAKVAPASSAYSYEWTCSPSSAKILFEPDRFCLNPTVRFEEIGDYTLTLNVSKGSTYIGSQPVTVQVRKNPNGDNVSPEIDFEATYNNGTDVQDEPAVRGDIQITVKAEDDNLDRIELIIENSSETQLIQGGVCVITAGTPGHPTGLEKTKRLDAYLSGSVTLKAKAIDRFGNIAEKTKTFTSTHSIKSFSVTPELVQNADETISFDGSMNSGFEGTWDFKISKTDDLDTILYSLTNQQYTGPIDLDETCATVIGDSGDGQYTATLTAGGDTATVTFDVAEEPISSGNIKAKLISADYDDMASDEYGVPTGSILTIEEGLYELTGLAYYNTDTSILNKRVRYKLVLSNDSGIQETVTPGILDAQGYCNNYVIPGDSDPAHASFGELDFSNIPNGIYTLSLKVECLGAIAEDSVQVAVSTPLKVGHVKFSQEDMSVNIGGYPIHVIRTYDGFRREKLGDFGFGWTYSLSNMDVDLHESRVSCGDHTRRTGPTYNRDVTLTLPGGQRVTFASAYSSGHVLFYSCPKNSGIRWFGPNNGENCILSYGIPSYIYWEGTHPRDREYYDYMYENIASYDLPGFELVMDDGTTYHIERQSYGDTFAREVPTFDGFTTTEIYDYTPYGKPYLGSIDLPTGEIIVFELDESGDVYESPTIKAVWQFPAGLGVTSDELTNNLETYKSLGTEVVKIYHDDKNRIIAIYGPGEADTVPTLNFDDPLTDYRDRGDARPIVKYFYDSDYGNLVEVRKLVDPTAATEEDKYEITKYEYGDTRYTPDQHYVTAIKDERGLAPIRYEYDGEGRLIATIDAKGNRIQIQHDVIGDQKTETVTDRNGNITDYIYNNRGNVVCTNKYDSQGIFQSQTRYKYEDTTNPDSPTEAATLIDFTNLPDPVYPDDYSITKTVYDENGKTKFTFDQMWNATYYVYVGENLTETTQVTWENTGDPDNFPSYDALKGQSFDAQALHDSYPDDYELLSTTENTYTDNNLLKTTETRDKVDATDAGTKWYSMSITLYDDQNRVTHSIQIDADAIDYLNIVSIRSINADTITSLPEGNHVITKYQYDKDLSGSVDQPYSVSDPYAPGQSPTYRQFSQYDENNRQIESWYEWPYPDDINRKLRIISVNHYDAQGRVVSTEQQEIEFTRLTQSDPWIEGTTEAVLLSYSKYDLIGKVEYSIDQNDNLTKYDYDETGNLVRVRTYNIAGIAWTDEGQINSHIGISSNVLTESRTLYDAEGRTLVSVGPYAPGDTPVGTETVYDAQGRVIETRRWANVKIPYLNLYGSDGSIVGLRLPAAAKPANAWDYIGSRPDNIGWTANGGKLPIVGDEQSYSVNIYNKAGQLQHSISLQAVEDPAAYGGQGGTVYKERPTTYLYDAAGRQTDVIDPDGHSSLTDYYKASVIDGDKELYCIDSDADLLALALAGNQRTTTEYKGTRRWKTIDVLNHTTEFEYDAIGRVTTTILPSSEHYDPGHENVDGSFGAYVNDHTYTHAVYDGLGRKPWDAPVVAASYNTPDAVPGDLRKLYTYDTAGRLITVELQPVDDPATTDVIENEKRPVYQYYYDDFGNQVCILDPKGRATVFEYDHLNRLVAKYMPFDTEFGLTTTSRPTFDSIEILRQSAAPLSETKEYDTDGRLLAEKDYKGQAVIYYYYDADSMYNDSGVFQGSPGQLRYKDYYTTQNDPIPMPTDPIPPVDDATPDNRYAYTYDVYGRKQTEIVTDYSTGSGVVTYFSGTLYDAEGRIRSITTQKGETADFERVEYDYDPVTGQKTATSIWTSPPDGSDFTKTDQTDYTYDKMARLETVDDGSAAAAYSYTAIGSRESIQIDADADNPGIEFQARYIYNDLNRLTNLYNETAQGAEDLSTFNYALAADGMRKGVTETFKDEEDRYLDYEYDNLNRLKYEYSDDQTDNNLGDVSMPPELRGYKAEYTYDLVGNRLSRTINVRRGPLGSPENQELTTTYLYHTDHPDRLVLEDNDGSACAYIPYGDNQHVYAYASNPGGGITYQMPGSDTRIGQFKAFWLGLPSVINRILFYTLMILIPVAFFWPIFVWQWSRIRGSIDPLASPDLRLWHRMLCVLLSYIFLVGPEAFHYYAQAADQYSDLSTAAWGNCDNDISYAYDENGSQVYKIYANVPDIETKTLAEVETWLGSSTVAYEHHIYNLQNRLQRVVTDSDSSSSSNDVDVVDYTYNTSGIRTSKYSFKVLQTYLGTASEQANATNQVTTEYLVDPSNHTGYAQVLQETTGSDVTTYLIGDDVLSQTLNGGTPQYLLYDGHGSTRQLASWTGSAVNVNESYNYDAYGVMLSSGSGSAAAANAGTSLLYAGEQYDADVAQYYLRARYYNQNNGLFNRMDPYTGNMQDPQSLHKYAYVHNDPINGIDPMGTFKVPTGLIKFFKYYGALQGLKILTGIRATYVIGSKYQEEVNPGAKVNKWISTMQELPPEQWIKEFMLRPDIVDGDNLRVYEIKPDNQSSINLGRTQLAGYVLTLAARHGKIYYPGEWPLTPRVYSFTGLYGMNFGFPFQLYVRNAGPGIIAYELFPSEEALVTAAAMVELSFKIPQIYASIQAGIQARVGGQLVLSSYTGF